MEKYAFKLKSLEKRVGQIENSAVKELKADLKGVKTDINQLKNGQLAMLERINDFQAHNDKRFSNLQAHTDNRILDVERRISDFQVHNDGQINALQAHNDARFTDLHREVGSIHREIGGIHKEIGGIHREISGIHREIGGIKGDIATQTRWLLLAILGAGTLFSAVVPFLMKFL